jgi:hypothetical protein
MTIQCPIKTCKRLFINMPNVIRHFATHAARESSFSCRHCDMVFRDMRDFTDHFKEVHHSRVRQLQHEMALHDSSAAEEEDDAAEAEPVASAGPGHHHHHLADGSEPNDESARGSPATVVVPSSGAETTDSPSKRNYDTAGAELLNENDRHRGHSPIPVRKKI